MAKTIGIFGTWRASREDSYYKFAMQIAKLAALRNLIVINGGYTGIMEAASEGASSENGEAIGYTWSILSKELAPNAFNTEERTFKTNAMRIGSLINDADLCVFFPGRTGTVAELALAVEKRSKGEMKFPLILAGEYWLDFFSWLESSKQKLDQPTDKGNALELYKVIQNPFEIESFLDKLA